MKTTVDLCRPTEAMAAINTLSSLQSKIRDLATAGLGKHAGIVVGILRGGDQSVAGYGTVDAGQQPPDENAIFEIGSVTKVFTTLLLAEMVLRGEVALDDPAQKYLPSTLHMPKWRGQEITLFHLATHASSLPRLPRNLWKTTKDLANPYANYQVSDMYEFLSGFKLKRPIGSRVEYSNLGMGLLGHILGLVAGKSFEELVSRTHPATARDEPHVDRTQPRTAGATGAGAHLRRQGDGELGSSPR